MLNLIIAIIVFFIFNHSIFKFSSKILVDFKKNNLVYLFLSTINTVLFIYGYLVLPHYYISYFFVLIVLTVEFLLFSKAKISQSFLCAGILTLSICGAQLIFAPIHSLLLGISPYELYNTPSTFFNHLTYLFLILLLNFKIISKFIFLDDIIKLSTSPIYAIMVSVVIIIMLTYTIVDLIVISQKNYVIEYSPMLIIIQILNFALFYILFFYSIKNVKIVMFKRKSDEIKMSKEKNEENIKCIENKILKDPLTCCYNRKYIINALNFKKSNNISNFVILFVDIDGLKNVNDTLGHDFGDEYIINVSKSLTSSIREYDLIARIGGDEFLILLNDLEEKNIKQILARMYKKIDYLDTITNNYKVSISIGYIFVDNDLLKTGVENIINMADKKMRIEKSCIKGDNI